MSRTITTPDGCPLDLDYFVQWRTYLWSRPVADALRSLGELRGRRVLEIGGRTGRMTSLLAMLGAEVTMLDMVDTSEAEAECEKWGVTDRVRLLRTDGGFDVIAGEQFDVAFTKSVLWSIEHLEEFLIQIKRHLRDEAKVAFVENYRGSPLVFWIRRNIVRRGRFPYENIYYGIKPEHLDIFGRQFDEVRIRRHRYFVYEIDGLHRLGNDR